MEGQAAVRVVVSPELEPRMQIKGHVTEISGVGSAPQANGQEHRFSLNLFAPEDTRACPVTGGGIRHAHPSARQATNSPEKGSRPKDGTIVSPVTASMPLGPASMPTTRLGRQAAQVPHWPAGHTAPTMPHRPRQAQTTQVLAATMAWAWGRGTT